MVDAGQRPCRSPTLSGDTIGQCQRRDLCDQAGRSGSADLVADYLQRFTLAAEAQHGLHEVVAAGAVDPAGAEDQVLTTALLDGFVTFELGLAVNAKRAGGVAFMPG